MSTSLSVGQIVLLCSYAFGMAAGQMLFKAASFRLPSSGAIVDRAIGLAGNGYLLLALALYFGLSLLWVWVLSFTPLSRAYPFVALAFAVTPLLGAWLFAEPISPRLLIGIAVILCGLVLVAE
jgi:drug/metabolite transporter (DMT)-like permease